MVVSWDLSNAHEKEVNKLENKLQEYTDKKASLDKHISQCRAKILELTKEIVNLEKQKVELAREKSLDTRETIYQEATKGVEHVEVVINLGLEIDYLEEAHDRLNATLEFSKTKLKEFKSKFLV